MKELRRKDSPAPKETFPRARPPLPIRLTLDFANTLRPGSNHTMRGRRGAPCYTERRSQQRFGGASIGCLEFIFRSSAWTVYGPSPPPSAWWPGWRPLHCSLCWCGLRLRKCYARVEAWGKDIAKADVVSSIPPRYSQ